MLLLSIVKHIFLLLFLQVQLVINLFFSVLGMVLVVVVLVVLVLVLLVLVLVVVLVVLDLDLDLDLDLVLVLVLVPVLVVVRGAGARKGTTGRYIFPRRSRCCRRSCRSPCYCCNRRWTA